MDSRVVGVLLLALGLFGTVAVGGVAAETQPVQGETTEGEADIVIQSLDYNETVQIGGALSVDYTLENVGDADGTESFVDLLVEGTDNAFDDTDFDVNVSAGGTTSGTLSFDGIGDYYEPGDTIHFSVELWDSGDAAAGQATYEVPDEPILQLASVDAPTTIEAGADLTVNYTIENIGGAAGTESAADLLVDGELGDTDQDVTVPAQDSVSGSLTFEGVTVSEALEMLDGAEDVATSADSGVEVSDAVRTASGPTEVIVEFAGAPGASSTDELQAHASDVQQPLTALASANEAVTLERTFWLNPMALVEVNLDRTSVAELASLPNVEAVYENARFTVDSGPATGALLSDQVSADNSYTYGLEQINAPTAWQNHDTKGEGASVAVLDTGVAADHPDLSVTNWQEFDGDGNPVDSEPNDGQGHGTHVSGTVSGPVNPAGDVPAYGVAPNVSLYGVKVLDDSGGGSFAQIIAGMEWATNESVDIISMSLGAAGFFDQMIEPVQNAQDAGTVVITSAGNSGEGSSGSPGNVYDSIAVGASNPNQGIASFSSGEVVHTASDWGDSAPSYWPSEYTVPSIAAPGVDTLSSVPGGGYDDSYSGTSMAAPHVSGAVALALSATEEDVSPETIEQALEMTAFKPADAPAPPGERDTRYGSGIIDADALTEYLKDPPEGETVEWTVALEDTGVSQTGEVFVENASEDPPGAAEFTLENASANVPVAGEDLEVLVDIENVGNASATQTVAVTVDGLGSDATEVSLGAGETTETMLTVGTAVGDAGQYEASVTTADDQTTEPILVVAPPEFTVDIVDAPTSVDPGDEIAVTAAVQNVGDVDDTQTVTLDIEGLGSDSTEVSLPFGESTEETFTVSTGEGDAGEYTATVESEDDSASTSVVVAAPPEFALGNVSANVPVAGEALEVFVPVENVGGQTATGAVELVVDGLGSNATELTLGAGQSDEAMLTVDTAAGDAGQYEANVTTADDQTTEPILVVAPPEFGVDIVDAPESVTPGEEIAVTAAVQNVGDVDDTQTVTLDIEGLGSDSAEVSLPFGESTEETFTVSTSEGDAGEYTATVESEDDSASQVVAVTGSAEFEIASADMDEALVEGETLSMTVEVTNVGDGPGTQLLQAHADGLGSDSAAISLGVGESTQATLALDTEIGDVGEHVVTVETEDHGIEVPVEVHLPEMPDSEDPPEDVDGDNYYENVNGDDAFDIFDVQMFFEHYDDEMMDDHGWAFNFNEAGGINIFDVQSLFNDL